MEHKTLNELNSHQQPLDTLPTKTKSTLKKEEVNAKLTDDPTTNLYDNDCAAGNLILGINNLRYKDGKGDLTGFRVFLDNQGLPRGLIPRYRGNRLHVLFHIAGILFHHHKLFMKLLENGSACGGPRKALYASFDTTIAHVELQVLGLIGKLLTGPWKKRFYTSSNADIDHC